MDKNTYLILFIVVMTIATVTTRLLPFVIFQKQSNHPMVIYLAKYTPPMIMSILVLYVLKNVDFVSTSSLNTLFAIFVTVVTHIWKKNSLLSIFTGTFLYMYLIQH
jgi:branched-subunit amino acid transport protein AzlD